MMTSLSQCYPSTDSGNTKSPLLLPQNVHYQFHDNEMLLRQQRYESNARTYPRRIPLALKRAEGVLVEDIEGRVYIDCLAGAGTLALGHNHPVVIDSIQLALSSGLPLHTLDLTTPVKDQFMQDVLAMLPDDFSRDAKIQFCSPSGTDAVEAALKLARIATGRSTVIAFHGAYHGMSQGALSIMGDREPKDALGALLNGAQFLPYPYMYRCPFGLGGEQAIDANLHYLETVLTDTHSGVVTPAAVVVEAIQGEGGVIPAPRRWLQGLRELTARAGVPLIIDEVQSGFARTGHNFAFEDAGITPDMVVLSKAIGGSLPLSVLVYNSALDHWKPGAHAGTFRGNQMAMLAGSATMNFIQNEHIAAHAASMGHYLQEHLQGLQHQYPCIGDIRGRGLMLGMEMVDNKAAADHLGSFPADGKLAARIQAHCLQRGLIIEVGGRNGAVVRFLPPLIISAEQIDCIVDIVRDAIAASIEQ